MTGSRLDQLGLPEGWTLDDAGSMALIHGPLVHPNDLGLVPDMAEALIDRRAGSGTQPGPLD